MQCTFANFYTRSCFKRLTEVYETLEILNNVAIIIRILAANTIIMKPTYTH